MPFGTGLGSRTASSLAITIEFSCFGRGNFMTLPEAGVLATAASLCVGTITRQPFAQSQLQRNVMRTPYAHMTRLAFLFGKRRSNLFRIRPKDWRRV